MFFAICLLILVSLPYFMKQFLFSILTFAMVSGLSAQNVTTATPAEKMAEVMKVNTTLHDFDNIPQGKPVYCIFELTNIGETPLKLDDVVASCGCTTPEWSREPIAPNATALLKVGYNAAAVGHFDKFITISYNKNQKKIINIKGNVWQAPVGSAPANTSLGFLQKQSF